ncbi:MAG: hypothetical protein AB8G11_12530 [Saprospiraceae bacterium]
MKKLFVFAFLISISVTCFAQVYTNPEYNGKSNSHIEILKVTITDKYTIVEFRHENPYEYGGYVNIFPQTCIRTNKGEKFKLQKVKNIPVAPYRHHFYKKGEVLRFKLFFPSINPSTKSIDIIESEGDSRAFNFYKIKLTPMA